MALSSNISFSLLSARLFSHVIKLVVEHARSAGAMIISVAD